MRSDKRLEYLRDLLLEWDEEESGNSFTTNEFLWWIETKDCAQWLKNASIRRLTSYLIILKRMGFLRFEKRKKGSVWKIVK